MYSLISDNQFEYFSYSSKISTFNMNIDEQLNIIRDPIFISRLKNVTPEEYQRTLGLIHDLNINFYDIHNVNRREFEFIVAELVRRKGFKVEVTKKTRDGGKDIIAIRNLSGIPIKIIVECKHPNIGNPVGVDIVRSLYGVHNSKNGPNKSLLVTSSYLTKDARNFVKNEVNSQWEMSLYDLQDLQNWLVS
ncbi:restriction endonuclease [Marinomonas gallaica]|uniref:restriction endonuclease n=1 Tax=Marinomonas gallaica TaxID=1806667 RepID=UPI003A8FB7C3